MTESTATVRTPDRVPATADVVIVGGGINGAAVAFWLSQMNVGKVLVIDARYPGFGASGSGDGVLRTHYADPSEIRLAIRSLHVYRNWAEIVGGTCEHYSNGFLWLVGQPELEALKRNVALQRTLGADVEILMPSELKAAQPHLETRDIAGAAYEPLGGGGNAAAATRSLLGAAIGKGASLLTYRRVLRLTQRSGAVTGVETDAGKISAPIVVLAAGAWSAELAASVDVQLPLRPVRCTTGRVFIPSDLSRPMSFIDVEHNLFFRVTPDGLAHVAVRDSGHWTTVVPDALDRSVELEALADGRTRLSRRIPAMARAPLESTWAGLDGVTPDQKAILGPIPQLDGLQLCVGSSFKGFKVAPAVGALIAESIAAGGSALDDDLARFSLERFAVDDERWVGSGYAKSALA